jgi:hypothetical protein
VPETIYIETTIPSYLAAEPSLRQLVAIHQQLTKRWWNEKRQECELFTSSVVLDEAADGDEATATRRLAFLEGIPLLDLNEEVEFLGATLLKTGAVPSIADRDALHIAIACVHGIDCVLTWNCKHIANPHQQRKLMKEVQKLGYELPALTTPEQLLLTENEFPNID